MCNLQVQLLTSLLGSVPTAKSISFVYSVCPFKDRCDSVTRDVTRVFNAVVGG